MSLICALINHFRYFHRNVFIPSDSKPFSICLKTNLVLYHNIALQIRTHLSHMEFELYNVCMHELQFMRTHIRAIRFPGNYVLY